MRIFLLLWFVPLVFFWGWYGLSANDISFGTRMFSREIHDLVFKIYADGLGTTPDKIPAMVAWACIVDSLIVLGIAAFRWRAKWWPQTKAMIASLSRSYWHDDLREDRVEFEARASGRVHPAE